MFIYHQRAFIHFCDLGECIFYFSACFNFFSLIIKCKMWNSVNCNIGILVATQMRREENMSLPIVFVCLFVKELMPAEMREIGGGVTCGCCLACMWPSTVAVGGVSQKALHLRPFSRDSCAVAQQYLFFFLFKSENLLNQLQMTAFQLRPLWSACTEQLSTALPGSCLFTSKMVTTSSLHVMLQTGFMVGSAALNLQCKYHLF